MAKEKRKAVLASKDASEQFDKKRGLPLKIF